MKKTLLFVLALFTLTLGYEVSAQQRNVTGKVTSDEDGAGLPGASILIKGTTMGTTTDLDGNYSINVPTGSNILVFSFIGLKTQEEAIGNRSVININLSLDASELSEIVVTALGIERDKSSLGYATQQVSGDNIRVARETNVNTALAGKIAGVQIVSGSGAKFGAPAIRIRGLRGISAQDPLYVLDGIIVSDPASINMDNIQDINVLKGANAAALYGSRARDGVVVLTSRKGGKGDQVNIDFNQTNTFEQVYILPKFQNEYGGGYSQEFPIFNFDPAIHDPALSGLNGLPMTEFYADESWGPKLDGRNVAQWDAFTPGTTGFGQARPWSPRPNNVRDVFRTGALNNTSINIGKSGENYSLNSTLSRASRTGVMENTNQDKLFLNLNFNAKLSKKLELVTAANYSETNTFGNLFEGYNSIGSNVNQWYQRQLDTDLLRKYYQMPDGRFTSWNINSPTNTSPLYWDNPFTTLYANPNETNREVLSTKFALTYEIVEGLKVSMQATRNTITGGGSSQTATGTLSVARFATNSYRENEDNIQGLLSYDKRFGDFTVVANVGVNWRTNTIKRWGMNTSGGLSVDNLFNISASVDPYVASNFEGESKVNSYFGQGSIGYKDFLYLDATIRQDYDSRLPNGNNNYVYPSVSASFVFTELIDVSFLSFGKLRSSFAKVGNEIGLYRTQQTYALGIPYAGNAVTSVPNALIDPNLRAATTNSVELGAELGFLNNRINTEFSIYHMDNSNELLSITVPSQSGGSGFLTNSIKSYTKGWELSIGGSPVQKVKGLNWDVNFNISRNKVFIEELGFGLTSFPLANAFRGTSTSGGWNGQALARENDEWGRIVGRKFRTDDNGNVIVNSAGRPLLDENQDLGKILPDFTGGIFNRVSYKNFELAFTIDYQLGGSFMSITRMFGAYSGQTTETVGNNDKGNPMRDAVQDGGGLSFGGVFEDGSPNNIYLRADQYFKTMFATSDQWMYDATFVKMRELRLGYNVPSVVINKLRYVKSASIALVANNPFLLYSKVDGIDPSEIGGDSVQARNNGSWVESGNLPGTRSFGVDLRVKF